MTITWDNQSFEEQIGWVDNGTTTTTLPLATASPAVGSAGYTLVFGSTGYEFSVTVPYPLGSTGGSTTAIPQNAFTSSFSETTTQTAVPGVWNVVGDFSYSQGQSYGFTSVVTTATGSFEATLDTAPHLTASFVGSLPQVVLPSADLSPSLEIDNDGQSAAQGTELTDYYLSEAPSLNLSSNSGSSVFLGTVSEPLNLPVNGSFVEDPTLALPAGIPPGTYYLIAVADSDGSILQATTNGNMAISEPIQVELEQPSVTVTAPSQLYDAQPYDSQSALVTAPDGSSISDGTESFTFYSSTAPAVPLPAAPTDAGTYLVVAHFSGDRDYAAADSSAVSFNIIPAPLSLTAKNPTYNYGQPIPAPPGVPDLGTITGGLPGDTFIAGFDTTATSFSPPGKYVVGVFFDYTGKLRNYNVSYSTGTLTIVPVPLIPVSVASMVQTLQTLIDQAQQRGVVTPIPFQLPAETNAQGSFQTFLEALTELTIDPSKPGVTLSVDLNGQTVTDSQISVPPGLSLVFSNGRFVGGSPALVVTAGSVTVSGCALLNATDAPAILVEGGSLVLRNDSIQQQSSFADPAIKVTGGAVDLGTAADPGDNTLSAGAGAMLISNTSGNPLAVPIDMSAGNVFDENGMPIMPDSVAQGEGWVDFNNDGSVDFNEAGIDGVSIALTGTDTLGRPVNLTTTTTGSGIYELTSLWPGQYSIAEGATPPLVEGKDSLGAITDTAGNVVSSAYRGDPSVQDVFSSVTIGSGQSAMNYNFGEQPAPGSPVHRGQAAGIGFWANRNGQALLTQMASNTPLGQWLAATLPNVFGNLAADDATNIANLYKNDFLLKDKLAAQYMATALNVYATDASLGGSYAQAYGFSIGQFGLGDSTWNVEADGQEFGVANNVSFTVMDLLQQGQNALNSIDPNARKMALDVFGGINSAGGI